MAVTRFQQKAAIFPGLIVRGLPFLCLFFAVVATISWWLSPKSVVLQRDISHRTASSNAEFLVGSFGSADEQIQRIRFTYRATPHQLLHIRFNRTTVIASGIMIHRLNGQMIRGSHAENQPTAQPGRCDSLGDEQENQDQVLKMTHVDHEISLWGVQRLD